jgi:hypothetical protein
MCERLPLNRRWCGSHLLALSCLRAQIIAVCLVALSVTPVHAVTYYVRKTGNDGNSGTATNQAWLTIDKAAATVVAGDVVYVGAGTYTEEVKPTNDGTSTNWIRFIADTSGTHTGDAGTVLIWGDGATALTLDDDDYYEWNGFKFTAERVKIRRRHGVSADEL